MSNGEASGKTTSARRMWEMHEAGASGKRPGLSLDAILDAAVRVADSRGVADLSMATLARELGYSTMALYRHVSNKAELLQLMVDVAVGPPPDSITEQSGWRNQTLAWCLEMATRYRERQWVFDVPVAGPPVLPNALRWMDSFLSILKPTGLDPDMRMLLLSMVTSYVRGNEQVLAEVARAAGSDNPDMAPESYGAILARLIPNGALPAMEEIVHAGVLDEYIDVDSEAEHEAELKFGMGLILDGIEALIEQQAGQQSPVEGR